MLFGAHCSGGIKKALDKGAEMGAETVQLFVQSPRTWRFPNHDPADLASFRTKREKEGVPAFVHALYLVNLAAPDDGVYSRSVETMRSTVDTACAIDSDGVVFHVGSHLGAGFDVGLERVVPAIAQVLDRCNDQTWLLMENSAGAGGTIGRSLDELVVIFDALDRHERLGVCLDSCHLFVSGIDVTDRPAPRPCKPTVPNCGPMARELEKVSMPPYVVEPPDVLLVDTIRVVPRPPYHVEPLDDRIQAEALGPADDVGEADQGCPEKAEKTDQCRSSFGDPLAELAQERRAASPTSSSTGTRR